MRIQLAVIGGGPAGLRAAEVAAAAGVEVGVFEAMPSVGRKFLVAGRGGLNLTNKAPLEVMAARYSGPGQPVGIWEELLRAGGAGVLRDWAAGLGVETFQGTSGRIYPVGMKAAPLLRRWTARLKESGVRFAVNHRWQGMDGGPPHVLRFANASACTADAVVLAMGGGSWPRTGSTGAWLKVVQSLGVPCSPLVPANCGWSHHWPPDVLAAAGQPIKNIHLSAAGRTVAGELLVTRHGLEGGAIYALGPELRAMPRPAVTIDFKPTFSHEQLARKMQSVRRDFLAEAVRRWRLGVAARAMLSCREWADVASLVAAVKQWEVRLDGPRPLEEAISSAGGVCWNELDDQLMIRRLPGVFVAGEMIDWEAPTGGYLIQGCFATGTRAGAGAARWLARA